MVRGVLSPHLTLLQNLSGTLCARKDVKIGYVLAFVLPHYTDIGQWSSRAQSVERTGARLEAYWGTQWGRTNCDPDRPFSVHNTEAHAYDGPRLCKVGNFVSNCVDIYTWGYVVAPSALSTHRSTILKRSYLLDRSQMRQYWRWIWQQLDNMAHTLGAGWLPSSRHGPFSKYPSSSLALQQVLIAVTDRR